MSIDRGLRGKQTPGARDAQIKHRLSRARAKGKGKGKGKGMHGYTTFKREKKEAGDDGWIEL